MSKGAGGEAAAKSPADRPFPIGGFFALALDDVPTAGDSVWQSWSQNSGTIVAFETARAALAAAIAATRPRQVWLPGFVCRELSAAAEAAAREAAATFRLYPLADDLSPDRDTLDAGLSAGDVVVVIDYFGWPPSRAFREWAVRKSDIRWIEDRAQALWVADPPWTRWQILSPRKLLGVPNGGLLIAPEPILVPRQAGLDFTVALPELMRFEDAEEVANESWYAAFQQRERGLDRSSGGMSRLTASLLRRIPIAPLIAARRSNYEYLRERLGKWAAWPRSSDGVAPFGFVIAVEDAGRLAHALAARRLFCARHWAAIPADEQSFPFENRLARHLLTLPCDHRYDPAKLERLVDAVTSLGPRPAPVHRVAPT
jgi:hypothetical protein